MCAKYRFGPSAKVYVREGFCAGKILRARVSVLKVCILEKVQNPHMPHSTQWEIVFFRDYSSRHCHFFHVRGYTNKSEGSDSDEGPCAPPSKRKRVYLIVEDDEEN